MRSRRSRPPRGPCSSSRSVRSLAVTMLPSRPRAGSHKNAVALDCGARWATPPAPDVATRDRRRARRGLSQRRGVWSPSPRHAGLVLDELTASLVAIGTRPFVRPADVGARRRRRPLVGWDCAHATTPSAAARVETDLAGVGDCADAMVGLPANQSRRNCSGSQGGSLVLGEVLPRLSPTDGSGEQQRDSVDGCIDTQSWCSWFDFEALMQAILDVEALSTKAGVRPLVPAAPWV
jgi:hypothetical protein